MAEPKRKLVKVDDSIIAFPDAMPDEHVARAIKSFRAKKKPQPLATEESEHARQLKPAQPLSTAIPSLPQWANTSVLSGLTFDAQIERAEKSGHTEQAEWLRKQKALQDKAYQKNIEKHPIATGVGEGVGETAEGLTSPANLALMITAPESKIMSGLFAIQALHGSYKDVEEARRAYREGRNAEASKYATQAILNLGIAGLAGHHAVKDIPVPEPVKAFMKDESGFVDPIKQWPQFKQWFGNSKVVDENGAPKPLFHSTNSTWDVFDPNMAKRGSFGFHAGTAEQAEKVRDTGGTSSDVTAQRSLNGMNIMPVYLKINNPLRMIDKGTWSPWELIDRLDKEHNIRVNAEPPSFKEGMRIMDYPSHMEIDWERRSPARQNFDIASKQHMVEWRKGRPDASREQYEDEQHKFEKQYVTNVMEGAGYDGIVYDNKYEKGGDSYMAFHPEQIKSAIGNSGAFDPKSGSLTDQRAPKLSDVKAKAAELKPTTAYKSADQSQPFYLKSENLINEKMKGPMPAEDVHRMLLSNGVKPEEMKWTGLDELLTSKGKQKVTPQEIQEHLAGNNLQIEEVLLGGPKPMYKKEELSLNQKESSNNAVWVIDAPGQVFQISKTRYPNPQDAIDYIVANKTRSDAKFGSEPKFGSYVLPGGENYRELLLTMPEKAAKVDLKKAADKAYEDKEWFQADIRRRTGRFLWEALTPEEKAEYQRLSDAYQSARDAYTSGGNENFRSSHWDEPNVLGHVRFNDRTGPNGEKILHLEELQSDMHQQARTKGYRLPPRETAPMDSEYRALVHKNADARARGEEPKPADVARAKELEDALIKADKSKIPDMPFKKNWHELLLKRMMKYAVDNGYQGISWTPGEEQAGRYDLSKQVKEMFYYPDTQRLIAYDLDGKRIINEVIPPEKLPDTIGKEAAQKLLDAPPLVHRSAEETADKLKDLDRRREILERTGGTQEQFSKIDKEILRLQQKKGMETEHYLGGVDLKVGGAGMKGFYDKIIPDAANKLGKQWGAKVGETKIATLEGEPEIRRNYDTSPASYFVDVPGGKGKGFETKEEAKNYVEEVKKTRKSVPYLPITPQMRAGVKSIPYSLFSIPLAAGALTLQQVKAQGDELQKKFKPTGVTQ